MPPNHHRCRLTARQTPPIFAPFGHSPLRHAGESKEPAEAAGVEQQPTVTSECCSRSLNFHRQRHVDAPRHGVEGPFLAATNPRPNFDPAIGGQREPVATSLTCRKREAIGSSTPDLVNIFRSIMGIPWCWPESSSHPPYSPYGYRLAIHVGGNKLDMHKKSLFSLFSTPVIQYKLPAPREHRTVPFGQIADSDNMFPQSWQTGRIMC
jgi:hypothetical protein